MHSEGILNRQSLAIKESWRLGFHFSHKRSRLEPQDVRGNPMLLAEKKKKENKKIIVLSPQFYIKLAYRATLTFTPISQHMNFDLLAFSKLIYRFKDLHICKTIVENYCSLQNEFIGFKIQNVIQIFHSIFCNPKSKASFIRNKIEGTPILKLAMVKR